MGSFRLVLDEFEVVAATPAVGTSKATDSSGGPRFDVIDRLLEGDDRFVLRDEAFQPAVDFCIAWLEEKAKSREH
ncbi:MULTISPECIES: hypothetical protein [Burkholderia]|uniref:hypothetical protein n=1 Tax=Burkholderia TaxID=32008 RepID=UPI00075A090A|nr:MULTISPECIES: hypothetical protein [Burkholderia]AOJ73356.1 hypothetical protein WS78_31215 [Burkholderia savannae]KVG41194.1 hypothetical protein WS77_17395 [Burkholderia sp. MSMB0265]KVG81097.1 hypothetical protein WS81_12050 [Burkholderia sp. MSMB2040]KVG95485.1 hypothetical protein WS82_05480 [Burkholderia sp. MSMB2041]KVG96837.1 hypothetical protein WS83_01990 [Burkholderia sp. MSMB2042]